MEEDDLKAELTCPICMDLFREPRRLPCGHVYCRVCLQDMLTRKYLNTRASERILSCPECRQRYDLTFQEAGVDVFPRDFKLVRLVELCEKRFSQGCEDGGGDGGAEGGADDQTAVKTVCSAESENQSGLQTSAVETTSTSTPTPTASASAHRQSSTSTPPLSREQLEAGLQSFGSSAASLSDDSWLYVSGDVRQRLTRPELHPALGAGRHERGDDSWLLPSSQVGGRFPVEAGQDVRGSAAVDYHTYPGNHVDPNVNISGRYDNDGRENFQRFVVEEQVQVVRLPTSRPAVSPSSSTSSDSDTSDERGDEGSDERSGDDVSVSGSEGQREKRQSRLSRFFRSLVMSESDSYDEDDDQVYSRGGPNGPQRHPQQHPGGHDEHHHIEGAMASGQRAAQIPGTSSGPEAAFFENGMMPAHQSVAEDLVGPPVQSVRSVHAETAPSDRNSSHNSVASAGASQRNAAAAPAEIVASGAAPLGAVGGVGRAAGRSRAAIEASDDSDEDYEPQTSMLRPKRKPRSRLKKFFTSLLSLSSSDDDEEMEGQVMSSTSATDRH